MKRETLYNLSIESPLLRDADILDDKSIATTWRGMMFHFITNIDASLQRRKVLKGWIEKKVVEGEKILDSAREKLEMIQNLQSEGQALQTLGDNVL